jgi:hypothetical protein
VLQASPPFDVLPRDVAGYDRAVARGQVRPVPDQPPALLPGRSANTILWWVVGEFVGAILSSALLSKLLLDDRSVVDSGGRGWVFAASMVAWVGVLLYELRAMSQRLLAEIDAGYVTTQVLAAQLTLRANRHYPRQFAYGERQTPWNCAGIWALHGRTGRVLHAPDRSFDAPGFYPSPYRSGLLELWTGAGWADQYRPMS